MLKNASTSFSTGHSYSSVHGRTHEAEVILTITGHELLFISLHFMVQNDYGFWGCMMNILTRLWIHIHDRKSWHRTY